MDDDETKQLIQALVYSIPIYAIMFYFMFRGMVKKRKREGTWQGWGHEFSKENLKKKLLERKSGGGCGSSCGGGGGGG